MSKGRPRWNRGRVYTPATTTAAEALVRGHVQHQYPQLKVNPEHGFTVDLEFHVKHRRARDVDNLAKLVLDALNGVVWADDKQVMVLHAEMVRDHQPGIHLLVRQVKDHVWQ